MAARYDTVSLLTDFGTADEFVGVVKSVIRDLAPAATVIDLTHGIAPYDVRAGSLALARCIQYVAPGVVVAVVDPGVGSARRALAIEVAGGAGVLLGPDNGLLAPAVQMAGGAGRAVSLTNTAFHLEAPGATFAGRDIFAPVAAHLCNGVDLLELGELVDPNGLMPGLVPITRTEDGELLAEVLWVDHYGNAQLNVDPDELAPGVERFTLRFGEQVRTGVRRGTYHDVAGGEIGLVVDSYGLVSVALGRRSAADELGLGQGDAVSLTALDPDARPAPVVTPVSLRR